MECHNMLFVLLAVERAGERLRDLLRQVDARTGNRTTPSIELRNLFGESFEPART